MAILDRIKYDGPADGSQWLIYKCPSEEFVLGSQLIVSQGQEALFIKGGEALDLFGPGTHTLTTGNLPILNRLVKLPFGGKTPFSAEVYYINKTANLSLRWGTPSPIPLEDPKYGLLLNVGARGQYGLSVVDSRLFVSRIIGAVPNGTLIDHTVVLKYFNGLINTRIKTLVAAYMVGKSISFLEITQYLDELSWKFQETLSGEFERFGLELVNFNCESIAPNPQEYAKLRDYKEQLALGRDFYQQRRSLDILEKAVENSSSGGLTNAGIGLGMGLGAIGQFGNAFSGVGQSLNVNDSASQITCPKCGAKNSPSMKFCGSCGSRLAQPRVCPRCGSEAPAGMKFCGNCGNAIAAVGICPACGKEAAPGARFCGNCGGKL